MFRYAAVLLGLCAIIPAQAQECPTPDQWTKPDGGALISAGKPSAARSLEGELRYHNGIRQWFELKLDPPQCGQDSIELVPARDDPDNWTPLEVLRGCRVQTKGILDFSHTGYYSRDVNQAVDTIEAVEPCQRQPPLPDYSTAKPDPAVRKYRVDMRVDYRPGDRPIIFRIHSGKQELQPWQAYASYQLTGGYVLYGLCGEGFTVDLVFGTPQARPSHFTERGDDGDMAMFDPEGAADAGHRKLHLGYTCVRAKP